MLKGLRTNAFYRERSPIPTYINVVRFDSLGKLYYRVESGSEGQNSNDRWITNMEELEDALSVYSILNIPAVSAPSPKDPKEDALSKEDIRALEAIDKFDFVYPRSPVNQ